MHFLTRTITPKLSLHLYLQDLHFVHEDVRCLYTDGNRQAALKVRRFAMPELLQLSRRVCAEPGLLQVRRIARGEHDSVRVRI